MASGLVRPEKEDHTGFLVEEIVRPVFDKNYKDKPLAERFSEYQSRKTNRIKWILW